jgi:hypothetical protein
MKKSEKLTQAILKSMGKEDDPIGVLIEAVLEKEFKSYDDLLVDCRNRVNALTHTSKGDADLITKINRKLDESRSTQRGPISG